MAGIKNHVQSYGITPGHGFSSIDNPIDRHMAFMSQQVTPYCKGCGKQLIDANTDESGRKVDYQAEQERRMCTKCYQVQMEKFKRIHAEKAAADAAKAQQAQETNWDELKKKYSRE